MKNHFNWISHLRCLCLIISSILVNQVKWGRFKILPSEVSSEKTSFTSKITMTCLWDLWDLNKVVFVFQPFVCLGWCTACRKAHPLSALLLDTIRAKNGSPVMKSNFFVLAKEVSPSCLCSREKEEDSSSLPSRRCSRREGSRPKQGQEGKRLRLSLDTTTRWPKRWFYFCSRKWMQSLVHGKISPAVSPLVLLHPCSPVRGHLFLVQISSSSRDRQVFCRQTRWFQRAHSRWLWKLQKLSRYPWELFPALFLDVDFRIHQSPLCFWVFRSSLIIF